MLADYTGQKSFLKLESVAPWLLMAVIVYTVYFSLIPINDWWLFGLEDGSHLSWIEAMKKGYIPFRDFHAQYGPVNILIYKVPMDIFGYQLSVYRWSMVIFNLLSMVISLLVAFLIIKRTWLRMLIVIPMILAVNHPLWFHYWGGLRMGSGLIGIYFFILFLERRNNIWLLLSGVVSVLSFFLTYEEGTCVLAGISAVFIWAWISKRTEWNLGNEQFKTFFVGIALALIPVFFYMIYNGMAISYFKTSFVDVLFYQQIGWTRFVIPFIDVFPKEHGIAALFSREVFFWVLYGIIIFSFFAFFRWYKHSPVLLLLSVFAMVHMISSIRLYSGPQLNTSLPVIIIMLFFLGNEIIERNRERVKKISATVFPALFLISVYMINFSFNMIKGSTETQQKSISLLKYERRAVNVPRLKGVRLSFPQASIVEKVCGAVNYYTNQDDRILSGPYHSTFSFVCDRMFYSRFYMPLLSTIRDEFYNDIISGIKNNPPPLVVWEPDALRILPHIDHNVLLKELYETIKENYVLVRDIPKDTELKNPGPWGNFHTQVFVEKRIFALKGGMPL